MSAKDAPEEGRHRQGVPGDGGRRVHAPSPRRRTRAPGDTCDTSEIVTVKRLTSIRGRLVRRRVLRAVHGRPSTRRRPGQGVPQVVQEVRQGLRHLHRAHPGGTVTTTLVKAPKLGQSHGDAAAETASRATSPTRAPCSSATASASRPSSPSTTRPSPRPHQQAREGRRQEDEVTPHREVTSRSPGADRTTRIGPGLRCRQGRPRCMPKTSASPPWTCAVRSTSIPRRRATRCEGALSGRTRATRWSTPWAAAQSRTDRAASVA